MTAFRRNLLIGVLGLAAGALWTVQASAQSCTPSGNYQYLNPSGSIYDVSNNPFGDEGSTTEGACVTLISTSGTHDVAWYAQWTQTTGQSFNVYAYPGIQFPGGAQSTNLPVLLSGISSIPSIWNYTLTASVSGGYDVTYDIWTNPASNNSGTPTEIMVWTNATFGQDGTNVGTYSTGGLTFTLYQTLPADFSWTTHPVYSFVSTTQVSSVNLDLNNFLAYLIGKGYVPSSYYLISIAAGVETRAGTGSLKTSEYNTYVVTGSSSGSTLIPNGTYIITGVASGEALEDPGYSTTGGADMEIYTTNHGTNQQWTVNNLGGNVITLTNVASGQKLDVAGASTSEGALVDQWPANGQTNQEWNVISLGNGTYELTSVKSGLALDVVGAGTANGTGVDQWPYNGNAWQQWKFTSD